MWHNRLSIGLFGFNKWGRFFRGIRLAQPLMLITRLLIKIMLLSMMLILMMLILMSIRLRSLFRRTFAGIWLQLLFGQLLDHGGRL